MRCLIQDTVEDFKVNNSTWFCLDMHLYIMQQGLFSGQINDYNQWIMQGMHKEIWLLPTE